MLLMVVLLLKNLSSWVAFILLALWCGGGWLVEEEQKNQEMGGDNNDNQQMANGRTPCEGGSSTWQCVVGVMGARRPWQEKPKANPTTPDRRITFSIQLIVNINDHWKFLCFTNPCSSLITHRMRTYALCRYIEIFRSTNSEFRRNMYGNNRPGPYDRGNNMGGNGGGMGGMGGGGPIRNNFNGPRGRMMRGGGGREYF